MDSQPARNGLRSTTCGSTSWQVQQIIQLHFSWWPSNQVLCRIGTDIVVGYCRSQKLPICNNQPTIVVADFAGLFFQWRCYRWTLLDTVACNRYCWWFLAAGCWLSLLVLLWLTLIAIVDGSYWLSILTTWLLLWLSVVFVIHCDRTLCLDFIKI